MLKYRLEKLRSQGFVSQGPLINKRQFERVVSLVDSAKKSGVKVVTGEKLKNIPAIQTKDA